MNAFLEKDFWTAYMNKLIAWTITEVPSIIITIIVFVLALKFFNKLITRLHPFLEKRRFIEKSENKSEAQKRLNTLINIMQGSIKIILWIIVIMILLGKFGVEIAPLLAGAGIVGLAIGFGSQELVRDMISGFFILLENQIRVGDVAVINGTGGSVEKIELRTITLRDMNGSVHIFQNGKISTLSNLTKDWSAVVFEIGVAYKEDVNQVVEIMLQVANELKKDANFTELIISDMEIQGLDRFDNSAVIIKARIKTKPGEQWGIKREYHNRLKSAFDANNIEIPFPHTTLFWGKNTPPLKIEMNNTKI